MSPCGGEGREVMNLDAILCERPVSFGEVETADLTLTTRNARACARTLGSRSRAVSFRIRRFPSVARNLSCSRCADCPDCFRMFSRIRDVSAVGRRRERTCHVMEAPFVSLSDTGDSKRRSHFFRPSATIRNGPYRLRPSAQFRPERWTRIAPRRCSSSLCAAQTNRRSPRRSPSECLPHAL